MYKFLLDLCVHLLLRKYNSWKIYFPFSEYIENFIFKSAISLLHLKIALNHIIAGLTALEKKI